MRRKYKQKETRKTNDEIRELILQTLYDRHKKARSPKSIRMSISELKKELKKHNLTEQEIVSNLDYLIQANWVKAESEEVEFKTRRGFLKKQLKTYYKISDAGINFFEGTSQFQRIGSPISGINITNIQGITQLVIGDQNVVVNSQYLDLYKTLSLLSEVLRKSDQLTDEEKLDYVSEIETIKSQLSKKEPDTCIIKRAWEKLQALATISGIASFFIQASQLISELIK